MCLILLRALRQEDMTSSYRKRKGTLFVESTECIPLKFPEGGPSTYAGLGSEGRIVYPTPGRSQV